MVASNACFACSPRGLVRDALTFSLRAEALYRVSIHQIECNRLGQFFPNSHTMLRTRYKGFSTRITNTLATQVLSSECPPWPCTHFRFVVFYFRSTRTRISSRTRASLLCYSSYTLLIRTKHCTVPGYVTSWFFHSVVVPVRSILNSTLYSTGRKLSSSTNKRKNNKIFFSFLSFSRV